MPPEHDILDTGRAGGKAIRGVADQVLDLGGAKAA
jgi:hypothetical protein